MGMNMAGASGAVVEPDVVMDVNTTPLIDVMLVLLVMLIITIPMQLHSVNLDLPTGPAPATSKPPVVHEVFIDFDGTVSWDGVALANRAEVEARLSQVAAEADQSEVHIKPNKLVDYSSVAAVMATAQRLGVKKMAVGGNEQFARQ